MICPMVPGADLQVFPDVATLSRAAADDIVRTGLDAVQQRGRFSLALAGGSTPRGVYTLLAAEHASTFPWAQTHLFFGDERAVPPEDPNSNFRMVRESLLDKLPSALPHVHRIEAEFDPAEAAARYEAGLKSHFQLPPNGWPRFDLILLGMGADGHTASLFPATDALRETQRLAVANPVPQLQTSRITLTFPVLNHAAEVLFLTAGKDKASMLRQVLWGDPNGLRYPSQDVQPISGRLVWMVDAAAAAELPQG